MATTKHICEFGTIWNSHEFHPEKPKDRFDCLFLDDRSFQSLKNFVAENNDPESEIEQAFSLHRKKGKDFITVKNYVGVIETRQGTVIEILPKTYQSENVEDSEKKNVSKTILLKMLRSLRNAPFKSIDQAHLKASRMPILEIFISVFLKEMEVLLKRGIKHHYSSTEENHKYLKGRLLFSENVKQNLVRRERFFVNYDEFKADIPQNRILKSALVYLKDKSKSAKKIRQIISFLYLFEEVSECKNLEKDLQNLNGQNRLFNHYEVALQWAKVFLQNKSFTSYKGNHLNTAILFPMEILFESYVAHKIKQTFPQWEVSTQDKKHFLVNDLNISQNKFRIRPDLVIHHQELTIIADTKWKIINQNLPSANYNISQSDMYQLFAYGKKYQINNGNTHLILIYPNHADFNNQLHFKYEEELRIDIVPFDFQDESTSLKIYSELFLR
jgi:5-methylcytosine-specific restriction enzyme subunit McrC